MSSTRSALVNFKAVGDTSLGFAVSGSMAADITGPTTTITYQDSVCFQIAWTSSDAVGVISVQGSVDNVTFNDITFDPVLTQPASNNGGYLINMALIPFTYIRVKYTRTSGTGNLTVNMSSKGN